MRLMQRFVPIIVTAALLLGATGGSALADTPQPSHPVTMRCADGACTVQVALDGMSPVARAGAALGLAALQGQSVTLPAGVHLEVDDDLMLTLPTGKITLPKAQLDVELGADNRIARLHGTAEIPFPTFGALSDVQMVRPAIVEVGLDTGKNLVDAQHAVPLHHAALDPDRHYLFFSIASGLDVVSKIPDTGESLGLSAPAGQALILIIDTKEPLVYLAGNITVSHSGEILLAGPLQDLAQQSELIPDALPMQQRTQVTVRGLAGKNADEYFKLRVSSLIEPGVLGSWLGVEATPLAIEGLLTLGAEGMLLDGVVRSSIEPDKLLDSGVHLTAFIPFQGSLADAFAEVEADLAIPLANVAAGASARLDLPLDVSTTANVTTPISTDTIARLKDEAREEKGFLVVVHDRAVSGALAIKGLAARGSNWLSGQ